MSTQVVFNSTDSEVGAGTKTLAAFGNRLWAGNYAKNTVPVAGVCGHLHIKTGQAGAGATRTFNFRKNGSTQFSVVFGATDTELENTATFSVAALDTIDITQTTTGTPANTFVQYSWLWTPTTADETLMCLHTDTTQLSVSATEFLPPSGALIAPFTSTELRELWLPCPGAISDLGVTLATAPGFFKKSRAFRLMKNGSTTTLVVTISDNSTQGLDNTHSFTVADGDRITVRSTRTGKDPDPAASYAAISCVFTPDEPDIFLVGATGEPFLPTGNTTWYRMMCTAGDPWGASEFFSLTHRFQTKRLRVHVTNTPTSPGRWAFSYRVIGPVVTIDSSSGADVVSERPNDFGEFIRNNMRAQCVAANVVGTPPDDRTSASFCMACRMIPQYFVGWP